MKKHKTRSLFYSLITHVLILALLFFALSMREKKVLKAQTLYHPIHLSQVHDHLVLKPVASQAVIKSKSKVIKKVKPAPKKVKKRHKPKKVPKKKWVPLKKKKPTPPKPKLIEKPKEAVVEKVVPEIVQKPQEVVATPTQAPTLKQSAAEKVAQLVTPQITPEEHYVKSNISKIMSLLKAHLYYPRMARRRHIEGKVVVEFELLVDGSIENIKIIEAHRDILGRAAVTTVERLQGKLPKPSEKLLLRVPIMYRLK